MTRFLILDKSFRFKQFSVHQDRCAMKVGTDGVLLGAWAAVDKNPNSILDIGAGTGLIALMLAQRSTAETIDALEIEENAYEQCVENFETSPWADRLFCYHAELDEFVAEWDEKYDLIVSNPPFFEPPEPRVEKPSSAYPRDKPSTTSQGDELNVADEPIEGSRKIARFNDSLSFEALLNGISLLLSKDGIFATIIPFKEETDFLIHADSLGLYPQKITHVRGNPDSKIKRSLLQMGLERAKVDTDVITIELERHLYTPEYQALTRAFYLKM